MKSHLPKIALLLALAGSPLAARAQTSPALASEAQDVRAVPPPKEEKPGKPVKEKNEKPEKPDRPNPKEDRKDAVDDIKNDFRARADEYVRKQKELIEQMKGAKAEERKKLRERFKELKEQWQNDRLNGRELVSELREKVEKETGKGKGGSRPRK